MRCCGNFQDTVNFEVTDLLLKNPLTHQETNEITACTEHFFSCAHNFQDTVNFEVSPFHCLMTLQKINITMFELFAYELTPPGRRE